MARRLALSWILVVSTGAFCAAAVETFDSDEGRFTIHFPAKPKVTQQVVRLPVGDVTAHIFTARFPRQTTEMLVSYSDYPPQVLAAKSADEILDGSVTGAIQGMKGTLEKSGRITQAGAAGREFSFSIADPKARLRGQGRIFLVGPRLYQIFIVGTEKGLMPDVCDMIFKSFEFKPAPAAAAH